ncbi:MAG: hypothetical protein JSR77_16905 [Planctomycetes bacterium]|nr:hypothetical protein [Planctomycetota bacterium]
MWRFIRTFLAVSIVSALIWVYAEAESLRGAEVTPEIYFTADAGSDRVIDVTEATEGGSNRVKVTADLEGSAAAIDAVERYLRKPVAFIPGANGIPKEAGQHTINLRDALRQLPELKARGITIKRVEPGTVRVFVDEMETRTVKVAAQVAADALDGAPELRPATITIRLPRSEAALLSPSSVATVAIGPDLLDSLTPGRKQTLPGLRIVLPAEIRSSNHARPDPAEADAVVTLRAQTRTITIASVPVHLRLAPAEFGKWDIEIPEQDRFLTDVSLTGPSEAIRQIEDKTVTVIATLPLSFEELERAIPSKEAVFADLPAGVRAEAAARTVRLKIVKREAEKKQ